MEAPLLKYKEEIEVSVVSKNVLNQVRRFRSFTQRKPDTTSHFIVLLQCHFAC